MDEAVCMRERTEETEGENLCVCAGVGYTAMPVSPSCYLSHAGIAFRYTHVDKKEM